MGAGAVGAAAVAQISLASSANAAEVTTNRIFFASGKKFAWLSYEPDFPSFRSRNFTFETGFYNRLANWLTWVDANSPSAWQAPYYISTYGSKVAKPGAHGSGRAVDIARVYVTVNGKRAFAGNMRYDLFSAADRVAGSVALQRYWGWSASIFKRLQYTLTYAYNTDHHNHIHTDNLVSGGGDAYFSTNSTTQVKFVQASLRHIWKYNVTIDGEWGPQSDAAVRSAVSRAGGSGSVTTSTSNWWRYCDASARFGWGTRRY